jgi:uncharacterized protein YPO0396
MMNRVRLGDLAAPSATTSGGRQGLRFGVLAAPLATASGGRYDERSTVAFVILEPATEVVDSLIA